MKKLYQTQDDQVPFAKRILMSADEKKNNVVPVIINDSNQPKRVSPDFDTGNRKLLNSASEQHWDFIKTNDDPDKFNDVDNQNVDDNVSDVTIGKPHKKTPKNSKYYNIDDKELNEELAIELLKMKKHHQEEAFDDD